MIMMLYRRKSTSLCENSYFEKYFLLINAIYLYSEFSGESGIHTMSSQ